MLLPHFFRQLFADLVHRLLIQLIPEQRDRRCGQTYDIGIVSSLWMQFPRPFPIISHATQEQQPVQILSAAIPSFARPAVASSRIDSYDGENVTFHFKWRSFLIEQKTEQVSLLKHACSANHCQSHFFIIPKIEMIHSTQSKIPAPVTCCHARKIFCQTENS